jgi:YspA, cpYpsA-related SLOG family
MSVIAIIGSRDFDDPTYYIDITLAKYGPGDALISGGARGVDRAAEDAAAKRGMTVVSLRPVKASSRFFIDRVIDGESAGLVGDPPISFPSFRDAAFERNQMIVREAKDGVTALWDGVSTGTAHGIATAAYLRRPLTIWHPGDS